ncbi:MAG: sugar phosphate isomerase/epimerase [Arcobacteraceae bacterium]|nr:sugar phosphate isomerase/epimerase [Arcobacteraceae bacterium]MDY0327525.1 TIM barrel protein [Arcobacteraceae bacterium]
MIYVSSSCVKHKKIKDSVQELANSGFRNIELSGGTEYYDGFEDDLLELKAKYNLNYICHNYFPPPKEHFVVNLASLDDTIYSKTLEHLTNSILLSKLLGSDKFGFHAGSFIDVHVSEIGKKISKTNLYDTQKAIQRFIDGYRLLENIVPNIKLYIENNVFSKTNYDTYNGKQFFMLCTYEDYIELKQKLEFGLLLDIAHIKVSSNVLGISLETQLKNMLDVSEYIHISDNDGLHDTNHAFGKEADIIKILKQTNNLKEKIFTLEIYEDIATIMKTYKTLQEAIV